MPKNKLEKKLEKLNKQINILQKHKWDLEDEAVINANKKYIGKYFKYENRYSVGEKWWLYTHITKGGQQLSGWQFENTTLNIFTIGRIFMHSMEGWIEISKEEFESAWKDFNKKLRQLFI